MIKPDIIEATDSGSSNNSAENLNGEKKEVENNFMTVYELLKKTQENTKLIGGMNHSTILYEVNKYLEHRPCANQNVSKIREYLIKLKDMPISLTKKEKLMLVNDPPDSVLQLSLGIKDFYDRLGEPETDMLLNASKDFSGREEVDENAREYEDDE